MKSNPPIPIVDGPLIWAGIRWTPARQPVSAVDATCQLSIYAAPVWVPAPHPHFKMVAECLASQQPMLRLWYRMSMGPMGSAGRGSTSLLYARPDSNFCLFLVGRIIWISSPTRAFSFGSQTALHITTYNSAKCSPFWLMISMCRPITTLIIQYILYTVVFKSKNYIF